MVMARSSQRIFMLRSIEFTIAEWCMRGSTAMATYKNSPMCRSSQSHEAVRNPESIGFPFLLSWMTNNRGVRAKQMTMYEIVTAVLSVNTWSLSSVLG